MIKGNIKGFPKEVVEKMLDQQEMQGHERDVSVFEESRYNGYFSSGFDWRDSPDGILFWTEVIGLKNFSLFFEKYPKELKQ